MPLKAWNGAFAEMPLRTLMVSARVLNSNGLRGGFDKLEDVFSGVCIDVVGIREGKKVEQFRCNVDGVVVHCDNSFVILFTCILYTLLL